MHVLHRDLSAQNVFLSLFDDIKVGDFGLSKAGGWLERRVGALEVT